MKKLLEQKLRELNHDRVKNMKLDEVVDIMVLPQTWDETFVKQVSDKYFEISKN